MTIRKTPASPAGAFPSDESFVEFAWSWLLTCYDHIVCCDFEFNGGTDLGRVDPADNVGNVPNVICGVFWDLVTGVKERYWHGEFPSKPPFGTGPRTLWLGFMSSAEWGSFLSLGWPLPEIILDPFVEFKNCTNRTGVKKKGKHKTKGELENPMRPHGTGLLGVCKSYGCTNSLMAKSEKSSWQNLCLRGGPYTAAEREGILEYCENDVVLLADLLPRILPDILCTDNDWELALGRALMRGWYMAASACMERVGTPIDVNLFERIRDNRTAIKDAVIAEAEAMFDFFVGYEINRPKFLAYLNRNDMRWPTIDDKIDGELDLEAETVRDMSKTYKQLEDLHRFQTILSVLKLFELSVGRDGRNRTVYWPFASYTGRNQPSNKLFIFGPDRAFRSLINPPPGYGIAYLDFRNQEFAIAAVLSGDPVMQSDYNGVPGKPGDPYLVLGKSVGLIPKDGTKKSHPNERDLCKIAVLAILYGQSEYGLSMRLNIAPVRARELLREFARRYRVYWKWREDYVRSATARGYVATVFDWRAWVSPDFNPRSIQNYPCQANAAEILRLSCCKGVEAGVDICCPVHDAVLILAPLDRLDADIKKMTEAMSEASAIVLGGFRIDVEVDQTVKAGSNNDHYTDPRGAEMWSRLMSVLAKVERKKCDES